MFFFYYLVTFKCLVKLRKIILLKDMIKLSITLLLLLGRNDVKDFIDKESISLPEKEKWNKE